MDRLTRDGKTEPVPRDQIFRREWGQGHVFVGTEDLPCTNHGHEPISFVCHGGRLGEVKRYRVSSLIPILFNRAHVWRRNLVCST